MCVNNPKEIKDEDVEYRKFKRQSFLQTLRGHETAMQESRFQVSLLESCEIFSSIVTKQREKDGRNIAFCLNVGKGRLYVILYGTSFVRFKLHLLIFHMIVRV